MIKNSNCLVTGHKGFIGKHLCYMLKYREANVVGIDMKDDGIVNRKLLYEKCKGIDYIFHLGAVSSVPSCADNLLEAHNVNVTGTFNLLMVAKACEVKHVVFASSSVAHDARTMYAVTKVIGETYCKFFRTMFNLPVSILRFYNVYGVGQYSETAVIPRFIRRLKAGLPLIIEGTGTQTRDFIYVDDVASAMIQATEDNYNGHCDIGTGISISMKDLGLLIGQIMNLSVAFEYANARAGDVDKSIATKPTWFIPKYSLTDGLTKTIRSWNEKEEV